jgi:osmotically inducible protein OsmC
MKRKASAHWQGDLKGGKGTISSDSGVLSDVRYSFTTRFENEKGTNPEELIAAAHAGCFSMALSAELGKANLTPESIRTTATVSLDKLDTGWTVTGIHLEVAAKVPGASEERLLAAARRRNRLPHLQAPQSQDHHGRQTGVVNRRRAGAGPPLQKGSHRAVSPPGCLVGTDPGSLLRILGRRRALPMPRSCPIE